MNSAPSNLCREPRRWFPAAVMLVGLSLTVFATFYVSRSLQIRDRAQFDTATQNIQTTVQTRIESHITLLRGLAAFVAAESNLNSTQFQSYIARLRLGANYPGVQGVGFSIRLKPSETNAFVEAMHREGSPDFHVWPVSTNSEYFPIIFLQPMDRRNRAAIGFDMYSSPERRQAMDQARDTGRRAATGKLTLVQEIDSNRQPGFLIYHPVYGGPMIPNTVAERRTELKAFIYSPFRIGDFLNSIFDQTLLNRMGIQVFDGADTRPKNLAFEVPVKRAANSWLAFTYIQKSAMDLAGHTWTVRFQEEYPFDGAFWIVPLLLGVGGVLSFTLFYLTLAEARARRTTEHAARQLRLSERALRESETRLRLILESARDYAIISLDPENRVTSWNSGAEQIFGFAEAEIIGRSGTILFTPEDQSRGVADAELRQTIQSGMAQDERWHQRKDGTRIFVNGVVRPMTDAAGKTIGFIKVACDVTDRLQAQETLRREKEFSDSIINSLPALFYLFDEMGKWLRWNKNAELVTGYSAEEMPRHSPFDFFQPPDREKIATAVQRAFETGAASVEAELTTREGACVPYLFFVRRIVFDGTRCLVGMGVDIGERHRMEQELREAEERLRNYTAELEQHVAERTMNLRQSLQSLEGLLYHVAHDLRAPLRAMASFTKILMEDYGRNLDERGFDYTRRILISAQFMDELVQDLLAYGRLAHTTVTLHRVSLQNQVDVVLEQLSVEIKNRQAQVEVERPLPAVKGNTIILNQVLLNLIANALKFVPPEATPCIRIRAEKDRVVRLWVEDNGIGIKPEYHTRIFRVFERLHSAAQFPGTGIGLAIVQKGVERMGGRVGVESQPDQGSRFWVELPAMD